MRLLYLDTSALNWAITNGVSAEEFDAQLKKHSWIPVVSTSVLFEVGRGYLKDENIPRAQQVAQFIRTLKPVFLRPTEEMYSAELVRYRTGAPIDQIFLEYEKTDIPKHLQELESGQLSERTEFILKLVDDQFGAHTKAGLEGTAERAQDTKSEHPEWKVRTFDQFYDKVKVNLAPMIQTLYDYQIRDDEAIGLAARIDEFLMLRARIRAYINMMFIAHVHETLPARDRKYDNLHFIDSSYCTGILSNDSGLLRLTSRIAPQLEPVHISELFGQSSSDDASAAAG